MAVIAFPAPRARPVPIRDLTPLRERARLWAAPLVRRVMGVHYKLGGELTIDKWRPEDFARKEAVEARMFAELDALPGHTHACGCAGAPHASCGEVNARGNRERHVAGPHCRYDSVHGAAIAELAAAGVGPIERIRCRNSLVNTGLTDYNSLLTGGAGTVYSNANANIGMGDSSAAVAVGQTDMQALTGATHRYTMSMDATYPTVSNGVLTFRVTFATGNGNFSVQEVVTNNGSAGAVGTAALSRILNRFLTTPGTKTSSQTWQVTESITLS